MWREAGHDVLGGSRLFLSTPTGAESLISPCNIITKTVVVDVIREL